MGKMLEILSMRSSIVAILEPVLSSDNVLLIVNDDDLPTYGRAGKRCQVLFGLNSAILQTPVQAPSLSAGTFVAQQLTLTFDFGFFATKLWDEYTGVYPVADKVCSTLNGMRILPQKAGPLYFSSFVPISHNKKDRTWEYLLQMQLQYKVSSAETLNSMLHNVN